MSELWGMAAGFDAADTNTRQNVLGAVQAQKMLGDIAMQPAHQRLMEAQAGVEEAKLQDAKDMQALAMDVAASNKAAAKGEVLTMADAPSRRPSMAEPLIKMYNLAMDRGLSPTLTLPIGQKIVAIQKQEAATVSAQAQKEKTEIDTSLKRAERVGQLASAALLGPEQYKQALAIAASDPLLKDIPLAQLPQDWNRAKPLLEGFVAQSITAKDQLKLKQDKLLSDARITRIRAANSKDSLTKDYRQAQLDYTKEKLDQLRKNGGDGSPSVKAGREEMTARRKALREAAERKEFPQLPVEPPTVIGSRFTWPDGKTKVEYIGKNPKTGEPMFKPVVNTPKPTAAAQSAPMPAAAVDDEDDSLDDEDD